MARKCARTFSIVVEKGKKSILDVGHLLPDALPRSVRARACWAHRSQIQWDSHLKRCCTARVEPPPRTRVPAEAASGLQGAAASLAAAAGRPRGRTTAMSM